ncbi:DUF4132 domain-containing protein [Catenulispora rubra]|uniref:DUF4132 domain-containing protein n=1 Tax=Catenulispora rubra TaxID=280293 RepID=UPI001892068B|nr:DUF4132 domain-containing protein [Catenulispora rubra]
MSGATTATDASSKDEDTCAIPEAMRRLVIPRRGGTANASFAVDPNAAAYYAAWLDEHSAAVAVVVGNPPTDTALAAAYRASNGDLATATPLAAGIAAAIMVSPDTPAYDNPDGIIDAWIATRGHAFAAAAAVELFGVKAAGDNHKGSRTSAWLYRKHAAYEDMTESAKYFHLAIHLRRRLAAAAGEEDYAQAAETLAAQRIPLANPKTTGTAWSRILTSFLMPEHVDWVEDDFALLERAHLALWLAVSSITTERQVAAFPARRVSAWALNQEPEVLWTALDTVGADLLPILVAWRDSDPATLERLLFLIACMPSTEAFLHLLDNVDKKYYTAAIQTAAENFPRRALHVLADAALRDSSRGLAAANLLRLHVLAKDELAEAELPNLTPASRELVEKLRAANVRLPEADPDTLPTLFVNPPWLTNAKPAKPVVITGLVAPTEAALAWRDGEREGWASPPLVTDPHWALQSWEVIAGHINTGKSAGWYADSHFAVDAPEDLVRAVLPRWEPDSWQTPTWIPRLIDRFGVDALPPILHLARRVPALGSYYLAPFAASEAALLAADWLSRLKTARPFALEWLTRHPAVAARTLIPVALGKAGKARSAAELTIRTLAARGFSAEIAEAAAAHGDAVAQAVAAIAADDGTLALPKVMPVIPDWAHPRSLPQVLLKGRQTALSGQSVQHLLLMLAVSKPSEPYAGLETAKDICDPASLAAFALALFENWRGVDYPANGSWAFDASRWFGGDDVVRRLSPMIRLWPGENGHKRAVAGLDVLTDIGGDTALMHLYDISQKVKFKGLKEHAAQRVTEIADDLGLTPDQLGDRLVPDLGLAPSGTLSLDYGPRHFTVGFDEQLKPFVADQSGKRLKALPKPGTKDDAELAPAAYQRFSALKKDVRALATSQITRFELAMVAQRRWTSQEFREYFVAHPLLRHLVRRLVWATFADGGVESSFRVAEDLTFADVSDDEYTLADDAVIGIVHPLHLGGGVKAWSDVFADYEILQPFEQLGRTVYAFTDAEKASSTLTRFDGMTTPVGKVLGLERRGWQRGAPQDAGIQGWISRPLPGGGSLTVDLDPGMTIGYVSEWGEIQRFRAVFLSRYDDGEDYYSARNYPALGRLDELTASELLRDLTEAMGQ